MIQFTDEHREEGKALQAELVAFQEELSGAIEEVWARPPETASKDVTDQSAAGMGIPPAKPQIVEPIWRVKLWDRK